jgi:hypothetical protein
MGSRIIAPSTDKARPAPRDIQTEKVRVLRPESLGSSCCFFLSQDISTELVLFGDFGSPSESEESYMKAMEQEIEQ